MIPHLAKIASGILLAASAAGIVYLAAAIASVAAFRRRSGPPAAAGGTPPVTILKPVCGLEHGLYENLRSFCDQDYPAFQVIFGVRDPDDPAIPVVRQVIGDFPERAPTLLVGAADGPNLKVSTLANMFAAARHDILVIADSDMRVDRGYLRAVASAFGDPRVGAATCLYSGTPVAGLPSRLGAMYINDWFLPSVLVALAFQELRFCFGATMAVRREALAAIGGFEALAAYLADDYMLGDLVARQGSRVALAPYVVECVVDEPDFRSLAAHELRWARTVRACRPAGYAFSIVGNGAVSLSLLHCLASGFGAPGVALLLLATGLRAALHAAVRAAVRVPGPPGPWLLPVRDLLCLAIWAASFRGRGVIWRGRRLSVRPDGRFATNGAGERHEDPLS